MIKGEREQFYTDPSLPHRATSYGGAGAGEAIMIVLNDILLFACAITLVTGDRASGSEPTHLIGAHGENGLSAARATESPLFCSMRCCAPLSSHGHRHTSRCKGLMG